MKFLKIQKHLNKSKNILILSHKNPDGDAIGSMLALSAVLKQIDKNVQIACFDEVPKIFSFLPGSEDIKNNFLLGDYDKIIILDCGDCKRTGFADRIKEFSGHKKKIINIDHHPKNDLHKIASLNLVDYNASSTAEIIYLLAKELRVKIDKNIALNLLCGLYTDTGSFMHSNTSSETLKIASDLLSKGARLKKITDNITNCHSASSLKLWGLALKRLKINKKYQIVTSAVNLSDIKKCNATKEDVAGIVNMINSIPDTDIALFMYQLDKNTIKASLRTEHSRINLTKLANLFGGGGLKKASGFSINGKITINNNSFQIKYV